MLRICSISVIAANETVGAEGRTVRLRWVTKSGAAPGPAVVYFHGGGYILGVAPVWDGLLGEYVTRTGVPFLSVDYGLAPEHSYPAALDDAYAALVWLHEHAADLDVDAERIAVMGDSAGAGLAASLAILARDRGGPAISRQILVMPMLDDRTREADPEIAPLVTWTSDDNVTAWDAVLRALPAGSATPPTAAPGRLTDAAGLPPPYIEVGQIDVFRDEDLRYALTLNHAGVPVEFHLWPGAVHEFDGLTPDSELAQTVNALRLRALRSL